MVDVEAEVGVKVGAEVEAAVAKVGQSYLLCWPLQARQTWSGESDFQRDAWAGRCATGGHIPNDPLVRPA